VFEGLQIAGIIYDKQLATYVPEGAECLSACSFMFLGGATKIVAGDLGVHQFSVDEEASKETEQIGKTQMVLSDLGLYKSTIDGFYGSGTESALKTYNEEYFSGLDLTPEANVNALFKAILTPQVVEVEDPTPALDTLLNQIVYLGF
tara:strand:- start:73 stop:513 length:441 start_codon:yes stop_codon:yes gene_type:complete